MGKKDKKLTALLDECQSLKNKKKYKLVLDVIVDNKTAISFYKNLGFIIEHARPPFQLKKRRFEYYKMVFKLR